MKSQNLSLFESFPALGYKLPHVSLASLPTPVQKLNDIIEGSTNQVYIKRDDLSGEVYGGNKIRKLEFLLGDALKKNYKAVMTAGADGSNHCLATAIYAKKVGLKSISMLRSQLNARYARKNLLLSKYYNVEFHHYKNKHTWTWGIKFQRLLHGLKTGKMPYFIPIGGSSPLGGLGFVNAAFELKEQIDNGEIPEPDYLYVASGTLGTAAGLTIGLKALGLKTKVVSVRVNDVSRINMELMLRYLEDVQNILNSVDDTFPKISYSEDDVFFNHDFFGPRYGEFTPEGMAAVNLLDEKYGIRLDGTYTGKAFAALLHDLSHVHRDKIVLFWNTLNSRDFSDIISKIDYRTLPEPFHIYFESEVQPLDKA